MFSRIALMHTSADMLLAIRFTAAMLVMLLLVVTGVFKVDLKGKPVACKFLMVGLYASLSSIYMRDSRHRIHKLIIPWNHDLPDTCS